MPLEGESEVHFDARRALGRRPGILRPPPVSGQSGIIG